MCPPSSKVEMGLTWIDHDTIEQPIEEISKQSGESGGHSNLDIEFKVETLRQNRDEEWFNAVQMCKIYPLSVRKIFLFLL